MISPIFFPGGITYYFSEEKQGVGVLSESELAIARQYGAKRLIDFCTGRYCIRQCTTPLGFSGDILIGDRGMPLLPENITASLSHSKNMCGAIAGTKDKHLSLGIDIETYGRVKQDMWYLLFTANEVSMLNRQSEEQKQLLATIFFSLKEAFYKMQYPLTGVFIDFPEVEVVVVNNRFYIKLLRQVSSMFSADRLFAGSMFRYKDEIITYCILPS